MTKIYEMLNNINTNFAILLKDSNPFEELGAIPINANTGKAYTKFNRLHLSTVLKSRDYKTTNFLTFKQICEKGGAVKSGEKAFPVFFSSFSYSFNFMGDKFKVTAFSEDEAIELANKKKKTLSIAKAHIKDKYAFTRFFYVFNLEQSEGIEYEEDNNSVFINTKELLEHQDLEIKPTNGFIHYNHSKKTLLIPSQDDLTDNEYYPEIYKSLAEYHLMNEEENRDYHEIQLITHLTAAFLSQTCGLNAPVITIADPLLVENWLEQLNESYYYLWRCSTKAQSIHDKIIEQIKNT